MEPAGSATVGRWVIDALLSDPEQQHRFLVEESSDILAIHESDGTLRWISPAVERVLGWTAQERLRLSLDLIFPEDGPAIAEVRRRLHAGEEEATARVRFLHSDGSFRWADSTARAVRDDDGNVTAMVTVTRDVHDHVMMERALAEAELRYRLIAENAADVVFETDEDGVICWISPSVATAIGWQPGDVTGHSATAFVHPDDVQAVREGGDEVLTGRQVTGRSRVRGPDGSYRWFGWMQRPVVDPLTGQIRPVTALRDVQPEVEAETALASSLEFYRLLAENASDVVIHVRERTITWVSPSLSDALGWSPDEWVGRTIGEFTHPSHRALQEANGLRILAGERMLYRVRVLATTGRYHWVEVHARPYLDSRGQTSGVAASFRIVDAEVEAREALTRSEETFRTALESAPAGMAVLDLDRRFLEVNPALCRMLDRDEEWLVGNRIAEVLDPDDDALDLRMRAEVIAGLATAVTREKRLTRADGSPVWVEHAIGLLRDDEGVPRGYVSQFVNITEARQAREELRFMATHDPLTRLVNRSELLTQMDRVLAHTPRTGTEVAALFVDLDNLKGINDIFGHAIGDAVIIDVAQRIRAQVRSGDLVARLGGDEFVVFLPAVHGLVDAQRIAEKIHECVDEAVTVEEVTIQVTLSIGVSMAAAGDNADRVLEFADRALYRAKRSGRDRTVTYDPEVDRAAASSPTG